MNGFVSYVTEYSILNLKKLFVNSRINLAVHFNISNKKIKAVIKEK